MMLSTKDEKKIVGSGLIAQSFHSACFIRPTLVLASGVSNSKESRKSEFLREAELVERTIKCHRDFHVLYCSTCSIDSGISSPYIEHKQAMERLVSQAASSFHVFRLPQVVGVVRNTTLVSHFVGAILNNQVLQVQTNAKRNLLDVRDLVRIATLLVQREAGINSVQNIASAINVPVIEIVNEVALLLGREPLVEYSVAGYSQTIDISFIQSNLDDADVIFSQDYWRRVLQHYVPMYAQSVGALALNSL